MPTGDPQDFVIFPDGSQHSITAESFYTDSIDYSGIYTYEDIPVSNFPIRQDITVLPEIEPRQLNVGWTIYEEIGIATINDYSISQVNFGEPEAVELEEYSPPPTDRESVITRHTLGLPCGRKLDMSDDI